MAELAGCRVPEDLYYWVEKHVWARPEEDGTVTVGITDVAQHLAKTIIAVTPKAVGRTVERGKSAGTVESGKWVGPITSPVTGKVVAVNERLKAEPSLVNQDAYGEGWILRLQPVRWEEERLALLTGAEAVDAYRVLLESQGIRCR
ncbi:MAG: glycine cleavage system protein GcvH [Armatimonadota bacterium]|nr:glycine cleavage system protein GcvH [Armatimonadota bacterium]MDR7515148.1 glycine cleavage system protein GcvH [Armatimonadota bacterium]MDR7542333.1 glycine cleavage system protein GcvH [Armatimonadota bacterium]MDR7579586.1 glycine cleavage system protein GcvH [Armatimonadota bacterium]MDR7581044.1 glycine cleavage system protein GcvH [Armatimonadota bacterium]